MGKHFSKLFLASAVVAAAAVPMVGGILSGKELAKAPENKGEKVMGLDMPVIYGSLCFSNTSTGNEMGLYQLPTTGDGKFEEVLIGPYAPGGGVYKDGIYYAVTYDYSNGATVVSYDLNSGKEIGSFDTGYSIVGQLAVDPVSNEMYGITFRPELGGYMLAHIDMSPEGATVTRIANLDKFWAAFAIDQNGQFYGITKENTSGAETSIVARLYKINRNNGALTEVGVTGQHPYDQTGAIIDPQTGRMFWTVCNGLEGGGLCEVDLLTGQAEEIVHFDNGQQISGLMIPTPVAVKGAPEECKNVSISFDKDSMEGVVTLEAPTYFYDSSTKGSGNLSVIVITNGDQVGFADVEWGETTEIPIDLSEYEAGIFNLTVMPINDTGEGPKTYLNNIYVGLDTPAAPVASLKYENGVMKLSWVPVTGGQHGGWIDASAVKYTVRRADGTVAAQNITATEWSENVAEPSTVSETYYNVTATSGGLTSAAGRSNVVLLGAFNPPYTSNYAQNIDLNYFTVIDGNADGKTWHVENGNVRCVYNQYENMDDWLIAPPLRLEAGTAYKLTFAAAAEMSNSPERVEVKYGKSNTADAMTLTALEPTIITNTINNPKQLEAMIVPAESGIYYIGFHGISDAYMYSLTLTNFTLAATEQSGVPAAPAITVTPAESGALTADVVVTAPTKSAIGANLNSLTKVEVYRADALVKTFDNPAPGATLSFTDNLPADAMYEYSAVAYNSDGKGLEASTSAFVGQDVPAAPLNVSVLRTDVEGNALVTWDAVTVDASGKAIHGSVSYNVYFINAQGEKKLIAENVTATEFGFTAAAADDQVFVTAAVAAKSSAGLGEEGVSSAVPVGTPYDYFAESFADGMPLYAWGEQKIAGEARWELYNSESGQDPQDEDDGFAAFYGVSQDDSSMLYSGLISLADCEHPGLSFWILNNANEGAPNNSVFSICIRTDNAQQWTTVYSSTVDNAVNGREGWNKIVVNLDQYADKNVQIAMVGKVVNYHFIFVDNLQIGDLPAADLAAGRLSAPAAVPAGARYNVDLLVQNVGYQAQSDYTVNLYAGEELLASQAGVNVPAGETSTMQFNVEMSPLQQNILKLHAEIVNAGDENAANNSTSEIIVRPIASVLPGANALAAESSDEGIRLNWQAPVMPTPGQSITQNFEDGDSFANYYGNWTFVDGDQSPVGGMRDFDIPGIEIGVTTGSFWVWDTNVLTQAEFAAHSGQKCLFSLFRKDGGVSDEWAISPELDGNAQTITFWAESLNASYPEKVEVWYSATGTDIADFVEIPTAGGKVPGKWTEFKADIPAGAKYFAIRSVAKDAFVLLVDDVTYVPADIMAGAVLEGYDIYRDGKFLTNVAAAVTNYTDASAEFGSTYQYAVVSSYSTGKGTPSNAVSVEMMGVETVDASAAATMVLEGDEIVVRGAEGQQLMIVTASGLTLYSGVATAEVRVSAPAGVTIVKLPTRLWKINK